MLPLLDNAILQRLMPFIGAWLSGMGKDKLKKAFTRVQPRVVARLEKDGHSVEKDTARWMIQAIEYQLWKEVLPNFPLRSFAADAFRDAHDEKVIMMVEPQVRDGMILSDLVALVAQAEWEVAT